MYPDVPAAAAVLKGHVLMTRGRAECPSGNRTVRVETSRDTYMMDSVKAALTVTLRTGAVISY